MNPFQPENEEFMELLDAYLDGCIEESQLKKLETILLASGPARATFVRYCRLETELHMAVRAQRVGARTLAFLERQEWAKAGGDGLPLEDAAASPPRTWLRRLGGWQTYAAAAACLLMALAIRWKAMPPSPSQDTSASNVVVASLINARGCEWRNPGGASGPMHAGQILDLHAGLAEIQFARGAKAVMEGPAQLELLTDNGVRLIRGKLSTLVSDSSRGFEVQTPLGKVVDLGTEFGVLVRDDGASELYVFKGRVEAFASHEAGEKITVDQNQAARLDNTGVVVDTSVNGDVNHFIRAIPTIAVGPEKLFLDFDKVIQSAIRDRQGNGIGLDDRLPGTGGAIPSADPALFLNLPPTYLELVVPLADLRTARNLSNSEFMGVRLSAYGFTGREDFEVNTILRALPDLGRNGQIGLYIGTDSRHVLHGGVAMQDRGTYHGFIVNTMEGQPLDLHADGVFSTGANIKMTLARMNGQYLLHLENQSSGTAKQLTIREPGFFVDQKDIHVGFYAFNSRNDPAARVAFDNFRTMVWTDR